MTEWVDIHAREASLLTHTLYMQSFQDKFLEMGIEEFARPHCRNTILYVKEGVIREGYRPVEEAEKSVEGLKKVWDKKKLKRLYRQALKEESKAKKALKSLSKIKLSKKEDFEKHYKKIREIFLAFFSHQVFPYISEHAFIHAGQTELVKEHQDLLVDWRKKTHDTMLEIEELILKFISKAEKKLSIDVKSYTDVELLEYFNSGKKVVREKESVMVWDIDQEPPYTILEGKEAKNKLKEIKNNLAEIEDDGGLVINKGEARGKAYIAEKKEDFDNIPEDSIVITRVVEMDDFQKIKQQEVKAIVTEEGGLTTHIAIVGRELEIPIIVGVDKATREFKTGDKVEVDADQGIIKKIEEVDNMKYQILLQEPDVSLFAANYVVKGWMDERNEEELGETVRNSALIFDDNLLSWATDPEHWDEIGKQILKKLKDGSIDHDYFKEKTLKVGKQIYKETDEVLKLDLSKENNKSVAKWIKELYQLSINITHYGAVAVMSDYHHFYLSNEINKLITQKIEKLDLNNGPHHYSQTLLTPTQDTLIQQQHRDLLKIAIKAKKKGLESVKDLIKQHAKKYCWLDYGYQGPATTEEQFREEVEKAVKKDVEKQLEEAKNKKKKIEQKQRKLEKELQLNKDEKRLIEAAKTFMFMKSYRMIARNKTNYVLDKLFKQVTNRKDVSVEDLRRCTLEEVEDIIEGNIPKNLKKREEYYAYFVDRDGEEIFAGKKAKNEVDKRLIREEHEKDISRLHGQSACLGMATGKARVLKSSADNSKVEEGDILISISTNPDMVPAMERAAAFVTNQGGITSHAAIVAREMNKPCIIGTKKATKIFKDGDFLEVNANEGYVAKIEDGGNNKMKKPDSKNSKKSESEKQDQDYRYRPENILWFKDLNKKDIPVVGGKGANLGEMFNYFPIPNGFCVTVNGYEEFMEKTGVGHKAHGLLDELDTEDSEQLDKVSEKIRDMILEQDFPVNLREEILSHYHNMENPKVAVRSSATAEDLPTASFAGQQDTYLNIEGEDDLIKAVQKCWASLFTSRAIYYRERNNFKHRDVFISVVIQEMIDAEHAGVMFTVDPVNKKYILVEVVEGLGEALVSGQVTPNSYFMNKKTHEVEDKSEHFEMDHEMIKEVSKIGEKIEAHYGSPQDVEFAFHEEKLYILQSRPITTL